jgi:hypothetical protein
MALEARHHMVLVVYEDCDDDALAAVDLMYV